MVKIHKFGGSNFISVDTFNNFLDIINSFNEKSIVVISALGKTTRKLFESAKLAEKNNLVDAFGIINQLQYFTHNLTESIIQEPNIFQECLEQINLQFDELRNYLKNVAIISEVTPRIMDTILSFGEMISSIIFRYFLTNHNVNFIFVDAKEIFITDENFNKATPLETEIQEKLQTILLPKFEETNIIITQGFIGKSKKGEITTMGFESSNLSALVLAKLLNSSEITIWTDVEGVYNADPNYFTHTEQLEQISYDDALKAAKYGNKLFYPLMIEEAKISNMTILYKSIFKPNGKYTEISAKVIQPRQMINYFENIRYYKLNKMHNKHKLDEFILKTNNDFYVSLNTNEIAEIYTNNDDIQAVESESNYTILILLNYHILDIYKRILNYNDLFTTYNFKVYQIEDSVSILILKNIENKELNKIEEKFTSKFSQA